MRKANLFSKSLTAATLVAVSLCASTISVEASSGDSAQTTDTAAVVMNSALNVFTAEIQKDAANAEAYFGRAVVLSQMNRIEDALQDVNHLLSLRPNDAVVYVLRGELLYNSGKPELALADLNRAVTLSPKSPAVYLHRAHFFVASEDWKKAERDYSNAIQQDPNCWVAYEYRAGVRGILGNSSGAEVDKAMSKCLRSAATGNPDLPGTGACEDILIA